MLRWKLRRLNFISGMVRDIFVQRARIRTLFRSCRNITTCCFPKATTSFPCFPAGRRSVTVYGKHIFAVLRSRRSALVRICSFTVLTITKLLRLSVWPKGAFGRSMLLKSRDMSASAQCTVSTKSKRCARWAKFWRYYSDKRVLFQSRSGSAISSTRAY